MKNTHQIKTRTEIEDGIEQSPTSIKSNAEIILYSLGFKKQHPVMEFLKKYKAGSVLSIGATLIGGLVVTHAARHGSVDESSLNDLYNIAQEYTSESVRMILNDASHMVHRQELIKGSELLDALGFLLFLSSLGIGVFTGVREGKILGKSAEAKKEAIKAGIYPYPGENHIVGVGLDDSSLTYSEVDSDGTSFLKALNSEVVLIQDDTEMWSPSILQTKMNEHGIYVSSPNLEEDGVAISENYAPSIMSSAYKAKSIILDFCDDVPLFGSHVVDHESSNHEGIDLSTQKFLVQHSVELRKTIYKNAPRLGIFMAAPKFVRQEYDQAEDPENNLRDTIKFNFPRDGEDYDIEYICREDIFIDMLVDSIKKYEVQDSFIYLDTDGRAAPEVEKQWKERCKSMLAEKLGCDSEKIITDKSELDKCTSSKKICVLIRDGNKALGASSRYNEDKLGMTHVFFPQTTREDVVGHEYEEINWQRIPIRYNEVIGEQLIKKIHKKES